MSARKNENHEDYCVRMKLRMANPRTRAAALVGLRASLTDAHANAIRRAAVRASNQRRAGLLVIEVPNWVGDLSRDYIDFGRDFGEIDAARRVRRLKADGKGNRGA